MKTGSKHKELRKKYKKCAQFIFVCITTFTIKKIFFDFELVVVLIADSSRNNCCIVLKKIAFAKNMPTR